MKVDEILKESPLFRSMSDGDLAQLAALAELRLYTRGDLMFTEGDPSAYFFAIARGRAKIFKMTPSGKDVILEIFGPGDPIGTVAAYEERPYPASAMALTDCLCIVLPSAAFFDLLEQSPTLTRGLLLGLTRRLVELTNRIAELTGGKVEPRLARLFSKMAEDRGKPTDEGVFIPLALSRQELADLTGTTIETCIRIMSRWGKEGIVRTDADGFAILDAEALRLLARL